MSRSCAVIGVTGQNFACTRDAGQWPSGFRQFVNGKIVLDISWCEQSA